MHTEYKTDCEILNSMTIGEKHYIINNILVFNTHTDMFTGTNASIDEIKNVFITSDEFADKSKAQKIEALEKLDNLKTLISEIHDFCFKNKLGYFNPDNK